MSRQMGRSIGAGAILALCVALLPFDLAAHAGEPYPGTVETTCKASAVNAPRAPGTAYGEFKVTTAGNGLPAGKVSLRYYNRRTDKVRRSITVKYSGSGWKRVGVDGLNRGNYSVSVSFDSRPGDSVYKNCSTSFAQKVRPARKR